MEPVSKRGVGTANQAEPGIPASPVQRAQDRRQGSHSGIRAQGEPKGPQRRSMRLPGDARGQPCRVTPRTGTTMSQDVASESRKQMIRAKGLDKSPVIKVSTLFK